LPEISDYQDRIKAAARFGFPDFMRFQAVKEGLADCSMHVSNTRDPFYIACFRHKLFLEPPSTVRDMRAAEEVVHLIEREIRSQQGDDFDVMTVYCDDNAFLRLVMAAFGSKVPTFEWRDRYSLKPDEPAIHAPVPRGYELREINKALLFENLLHTDELREEMRSERPSVEDFLAKSFGICAVKGRELAGWCLSEYNSSAGCEVGIAVLGEHRRKGLALAMTSEFIKVARSKGYAEIGWDCHRQNAPSWHTAIKAGLSIRRTYPTILICKDIALQYGVNGNIALRDGDGDTALEWYRKSAATGKAPYWVFINMAQVQALTGDINLVMQAYQGLRTARME